MPTARSALRAELTRQLVPALHALGFSGPASIAGHALVHEFRRPGRAGTQVLTLQLEKYGRPRFLILFCVEPPEGFEHLYERGGTVDQGRLQPRAGATTRSWFRTDVPFFQRLLGGRDPAPADVVARCVALLPEVEAWWDTQSAFAHVSVLTHRFPGRRNRGGPASGMG